MTVSRIRRGRRPMPGVAPGASEQARAMVQAAWEEAERCENKLFGEMYATALERKVYNNDTVLFTFMKHLTHAPVSIEEFLVSEEFIGATDLRIWPEVRDAVVAANKDWWKGMPEACHEILLMGACVDAETEFLTPTGWKHISDYVDGDLVGQYSADGTLEFVRPDAYVRRRHRLFYHFSPRGGLDMMLTPGHRVIYRNVNTGKICEMSAEEVAATHNRNVAGFTGKFLSTFIVTGRTGIPLSDEAIRVMVMVHADGTFDARDDSRWCNVIIKKRRKIERARRLLKEAGIAFSDTPHSDGYRRLRFYAPERNKTYSGWWECTASQLRIVVDEVMHWDGSEFHDQFYTAKKEEADFIQYAHLATGIRATMQWQQRGGNRSVEYRVKRCRTAEYSMAASPKGRSVELVEASDGYCYCFTLPTGMWLARRSGSVYVTGNTGTGKTEISKLTTLYHLYLLSCLDNPQAYYGLPKATSIVFPIMAAKPHVTKKVIYDPLRHMVENIPYFQKHLRPSKLVESEMIFEEKNIRVTPAGVDADSILGEAVVGGVIDEINFMNVVLRSKRAEVTTGRAGVYDQAQTIHSSMTRRVKGRFTKPGPKIGIVCTSSSTRYRGDFTDKRKQQVTDHKERGVYIYDKAQYEVKPQENFCGERFRLLVGNDILNDVRILEEGDSYPEGARILSIPIEYESEFRRDPPSALRDICGISTSSISPFIQRRFKIYEAITAGEEEGLASILVKDNVILGVDGMPVVKFNHYCTDPSKPRYVHVDLSKTGDRCGVAMLRYDGLATTTRSNGAIESLPVATIEVACSIEPDSNNEIDFAEVRTWIKQLRDIYGYPIKAVTYDGIFSIESIQQWRKLGMKTGNISVDRTSAPYKNLRDAYNDNRIHMFQQDVLVNELFELEFDDDKDKVDHPVNGSKDVADAVCGAYYSLLTRRSSWVAVPERGSEQQDRPDLGDRYDDDRRY